MRIWLALVPLLTLLVPKGIAANDVPDWVKALSVQKVPEYPAKITSAILFQEEFLTVDADGKRTMRERGAVKILQPGSEKPVASRTYNLKSGKIRDFQGWMLPPSGKPVFYSKDRIVDVAVTDGLYEELRMKMLQSDATVPGSIFAWEVTEEEKTVFTQYQYSFQERLPVVTSRFSVALPPGWETESSILNHEPLNPKVFRNEYSWELRDLPAIESEDYSPSLTTLAPRLVLSYFPPIDNAAGLRGLKDWSAVSTWLASLVDPPAEPGDPVRAKAAQLTTGKSNEIDKISAIASFVQQTKYVAVSLNLTRGGGYTPRKSDDVLSKNYGDCKDKATLMRALLKSAGIDTYFVTVTADDRTYVNPGWASPMQFNHAIVAVRVSDTTTLPATINSPTLGRLLLFDPTDSVTPVGDLPEDEQGSYGLVVAGSNGALVKLPALPASANRIESLIEATVDLSGKLNAHVQRRYFGQSGVGLRGIEKFGGSGELRKRFERSYARRLPGTALTNIGMELKPEENVVAVNVDLTADRFGQIMQGRLFVVRAGLLTSGGEYGFSSKERATPVKLESDLRKDSIRIKLPAGFKLDELPDPQKFESPYGTIQATWKVENSQIVMEETLEIRETVAPPSDYAKVRNFFDLVAGVHGAAVVLTKE
jgi:transglutaminase-like putative cysteine protease